LPASAACLARLCGLTRVRTLRERAFAQALFPNGGERQRP
jgi:hypothetical protein